MPWSKVVVYILCHLEERLVLLETDSGQVAAARGVSLRWLGGSLGEQPRHGATPGLADTYWRAEGNYSCCLQEQFSDELYWWDEWEESDR